MTAFANIDSANRAMEVRREIEAEMYGESNEGWVVYPDASDHGTSWGPFTKADAFMFLLNAKASNQHNLFAVNKRDLPNFFNC